MANVAIRVIGVDRFAKLSDKYRNIARLKAAACAEKAVRAATEFVAAEIKRRLETDLKHSGDQIFSGRLVNSAYARVRREAGGVAVGEIVFPQEYARFLEQGRAPGEGLETKEKRDAERERLRIWAERKKPGENARDVAGKILGKLLRKGITKSNSAVGFVQPVLDANRIKIPEIIQTVFLKHLEEEFEKLG